MKLINKAVALVLALYGSLALADNCSPTLMGNLSKEYFNGLELYDYIQKIGFEVFSGAKNKKDSGISDLLATNPKIQKLNQRMFAPWQTLGECIAAYSNTQWSQSAKAGTINHIDDRLRKQELAITVINNIVVNYSNNLKSAGYIQKLQDAINDIKTIFAYSLSQLPMEWRPKTPEELIDAYKINTGITFDPKQFFDEYEHAKTIADEKGLKRSAYEAFIFNEVIDKNYLQHFNKEHIAQNMSDAEVQQMKISSFINLLEELMYQSKTYKPKYFWSAKPKGLFTQEQQALAQEIVNLLYCLYPENEKLFMKRVALANSQQYKMPLLIFAQSRVLLIVLRAYLKISTKR